LETIGAGQYSRWSRSEQAVTGAQLCHDEEEAAVRVCSVDGKGIPIRRQGEGSAQKNPNPASSSENEEKSGQKKVSLVARFSHKNFTRLSKASNLLGQSAKFSIASWKLPTLSLHNNRMAKLRKQPIIWA
jgi:hypothetical protein